MAALLGLSFLSVISVSHILLRLITYPKLANGNHDSHVPGSLRMWTNSCFTLGMVDKFVCTC